MAMTKNQKDILLLMIVVGIMLAAVFIVKSSPKSHHDTPTEAIGAIDRAMILRTKMNKTSEEAEKYHISCLSSYQAACLILTKKAEANEKLREALNYAFANNVRVRAVTWSSVENSEVNVNPLASEKNIIEFLMGKKSP